MKTKKKTRKESDVTSGLTMDELELTAIRACRLVDANQMRPVLFKLLADVASHLGVGLDELIEAANTVAKAA